MPIIAQLMTMKKQTRCLQLETYLWLYFGILGVVNEAAMQLWRIVDDSSDNVRILLPVFLLGKADTLVFEHIVSAVENTLAINNFVCRLAFLPDDEKGPKHMDLIETGEVRIASVKDIAGKSFVCEPVHRVDMCTLALVIL